MGLSLPACPPCDGPGRISSAELGFRVALRLPQNSIHDLFFFFFSGFSGNDGLDLKHLGFQALKGKIMCVC